MIIVYRNIYVYKYIFFVLFIVSYMGMHIFGENEMSVGFSGVDVQVRVYRCTGVRVYG